MSEAKAIQQQQPKRPELPFVPSNVDEAWRISEMLSKSNLIPDQLKQKPHDVIVCVMTGTELGLSPMQSLREVYVVKGKGYISSQLKVALVKQSSECMYFRMVESSATQAVFETERRNEGKTKMVFTIEDAKRAGLAGRQTKSGEPDNWEKYPALMLRRRCASQLADEVYPDVTRGLGIPEEVETNEHELNPPPARSTGVVEPKTTKTEQIKQLLKSRASTVIDVQPGETEEQAEARENAPTLQEPGAQG